MELKIPTLRGYLSDDGMRITVFCPYCDAWHVHSSAIANGLRRHEQSHRVAHCSDDIDRRGNLIPREGRKPTDATGYYVAEWRKAERREIVNSLFGMDGPNISKRLERISALRRTKREHEKANA